MYKEYRDTSRCGAITSLYQDMASRHRARFQSIQVIRVQEVKAADVRRAYMRQLVAKDVKFPMVHQRVRASESRGRSLYLATRPTTTR
jgi:large subunit ribosomal protein L18Ae